MKIVSVGFPEFCVGNTWQSKKGKAATTLL